MKKTDNLEITFRNEKHSPAVTAHIKNHFIKLRRFYKNIIHCHVILKHGSELDKKNHIHDVHVICKIPELNLVSANNFSRNLYKSIRQAFDNVARKLQSKSELLHAHTSKLKTTQVGIIRELFHDKLFGFIESPQGDYYFNCSHTQKDNFKQLRVGQKVRFVEQHTPQGQQARKVKPCRKRT